MPRLKMFAGLALAAAGAALVLYEAFKADPWQAGILAGILASLAGAMIATDTERPPKVRVEEDRARRYRVELVVPLNVAEWSIATLREMLEEDCVGLAIAPDAEHDEALVQFVVEATTRANAERLGRRILSRHGLVDDGARAVRA